MKSSDYIVQFFEQHNVDTIFGYIGGMITHLVDSIDRNPNVRYVQTYHEQTAAIAAEGYAVERNGIGVAISTSGPGATNMLTGIADAYFDSIPVIYITGQVNSYEYKYNKPIRQQGFQETDIISIVKPITKYASLVDKIENLRYELEKALYIATTGRKGPVVLDLPMDIQRQEINPEELFAFIPPKEERHTIDLDKILPIISKSERPMLLIGGGCQDKNTIELLSEFLTNTQMPVVTSLMGRGVINETYPNYLGMVGSYGNRSANMAISNADLLIVLGSRLDTRQTGAKIESFLPDSTIIHVDIDNNELECHRILRQIKVNSSVCEFLEAVMPSISLPIDFSKWNNHLQSIKSTYTQKNEVHRFVDNKVPYICMDYINGIMKSGDIVTTDVGQNQMWAAQTLNLKSGQTYLTSGGLAPMGYSMPSAIGCAFSNHDRNIFSIVGDGGFHISLQALPLIAQYKLNIKVCVLNNQSLGMITQFQHLYFEDRMAGTVEAGGYYSPNIEALAKAYGIEYFAISENNINDVTLKEKIALTHSCLVEFKMEKLTTVSPKLEYDKPISMPTPQLSDEEYIRAMKMN